MLDIERCLIEVTCTDPNFHFLIFHVRGKLLIFLPLHTPVNIEPL